MPAGSCALARAKLARKVAELRDAGTLEKATTAIKAGFVGSVVTPLRAVVGNASWGGLRHLALQPAESAVDYMLSVGKSARTGFKVQPHEFREISNALDADGVRAMWSGFRKGGKPISGAYQAAKGAGGPIPKRVAAFVQELSTRLDADNVAKVLDVERVKYSSPVTQTLIDGAFAVLEAADRPFWKLAFDGSIYMQSKLMAIREGLSGPARRSRSAYYFENPTDEMNLRAADDANYATFKDKNMMSRGASNVKRFLKSAAEKAPDPGATGYDRVRQKAKQRGGKVAHYIVETNMPFTGVPSSVAAKILQVSPLGLFSPSIFGSQAERARALATAGGGSAIMAAGFLLAKKGLVTQGLPSNPKERAQWDEEGRQPWSVKIGRDWVGIQALGPVASPLFMGAKLFDVRAQSPEAGAGEQAARVAAGAGQFFTQQTYLQQVSRLIDAAQDEKKATSLLVSQIPFPAAGGQVNRAIDKMQRSTSSVKNQILTKIPGASQFAPEKLSPTGRPLERSPEERVSSILSPLPIRRATETPLLSEMRRLGVTFGMPTHAITFRGKKVTLTEAEYRELVQSAGPRAEIALENLMKRPQYAAASDEQKKKAFERVIDRTRDRARAPVRFEKVSGLLAAQRGGAVDPIDLEARRLGVRAPKDPGDRAVFKAVVDSPRYKSIDTLAAQMVETDPKYRGKNKNALARELKRSQIEEALSHPTNGAHAQP
jgi:hypothetical protein